VAGVGQFNVSMRPWSGQQFDLDQGDIRKETRPRKAEKRGVLKPWKGSHNMQDGNIVALNEVKARWVLSELASARTSVHYQSSQLQDIISKVAGGSTFESLSPKEVERLVHSFESARGIFLNHYLQNTSKFELQNWSKAELEKVSGTSVGMKSPAHGSGGAEFAA